MSGIDDVTDVDVLREILVRYGGIIRAFPAVLRRIQDAEDLDERTGIADAAVADMVSQLFAAEDLVRTYMRARGAPASGAGEPGPISPE